MKISASIYSRNFQQQGPGLEQTVRALDAHRVDYIHVDCNDDQSVFDDIRQMRQWSRTPIDLHLITPDPMPFLPMIRECGVELVAVQQENLQQALEVPEDLRSRFGLAVQSGTPIEIFDSLQKQLRFALFMATIPGRSGGQFDRSNFRRIRLFKKRYPGLRIHVDGGVDEEVSFILRNMGVYAAVSGSFLLSQSEEEKPLGAQMIRLMHSGHTAMGAEQGRFCVRDFMMERDEIPLLPLREQRFDAVLQCIEDFSMGFALLETDEHKLAGLVSNAEVRRGLLRHRHDLNRVSMVDVINPSPLFAREEDSLATLLQRIKSHPGVIGYLPVLDAEDRITGALQFNNLIKGES